MAYIFQKADFLRITCILFGALPTPHPSALAVRTALRRGTVCAVRAVFSVFYHGTQRQKHNENYDSQYKNGAHNASSVSPSLYAYRFNLTGQVPLRPEEQIQEPG